MKNLIMYMYNLNNINIYKTKEKIVIKSNSKKYYFEKIINEKRLIEVNEVLKNKTEHNKIIKNIYGQLYTEYHQNKYVLLEENSNYIIHSNNIILNAMEYKNYSINQSNWIMLWSKKNDFYENHIPTNKYLIESKDYYMGMAENAIQYVKYHNQTTEKLVINYLNIKDDTNPINIILDCNERKIAEGIKYDFFEEDKNILDICTKLDKKIYNYNIEKIYSRLLYPNYYFNIYDEFIIGEGDEEKLKQIISKVNKYEELLAYIATKYNIDCPEWIKKD